MKVKENHMKTGFLPLFEFLAYQEQKKRALEKEHASEKELATEKLVSKHVGQVHHRAVVMVRD